MKFTHQNGEFRLSNVGETVFIKGWVQRVRNLGGLLFIDLRDLSGVVQLSILPGSSYEEIALTLKMEYVVYVRGTVKERSSKNLKMPTGEIEIEPTSLEIVSTALTPPFVIKDDVDALEDTRLKYRYLDLRRNSQANYLIKRSQITQSIRNTLLAHGFNEFETPILAKSTPEGARDYLVPSRIYPGQFFALPQSPQIFKQLLMIAGFEKYFQIARCFRDEDLRSDRQPEFTQVDIEVSFWDEEEIFALTESVLANVYSLIKSTNLVTPFQKMSFHDAMRYYGSDKPDLRYQLLIEECQTLKEANVPFFKDQEVVRFLRIPYHESFTRKTIEEYERVVKKNHGKNLATLFLRDGILSGSLAKFFEKIPQCLNNNDALFIVCGKEGDVSSALGALRVRLADDFQLVDRTTDRFVWIVDWPLLEYSEEDQRYYSTHHPFTAPVSYQELKDSPSTVLARQYDIVMNGYELGGGSIRIHDQETQRLMFETLGLSDYDIKHRFGFMVEALSYGTPPHGGIALGLDRIVMLLTGTSNIKDVVAFPKVQSTRDLMSNSPSEVKDEQLSELGIEIKK
jgi:aspartyl-tRNA synthetase